MSFSVLLKAMFPSLLLFHVMLVCWCACFMKKVLKAASRHSLIVAKISDAVGMSSSYIDDQTKGKQTKMSALGFWITLKTGAAFYSPMQEQMRVLWGPGPTFGQQNGDKNTGANAGPIEVQGLEHRPILPALYPPLVQCLPTNFLSYSSYCKFLVIVVR